MHDLNLNNSPVNEENSKNINKEIENKEEDNFDKLILLHKFISDTEGRKTRALFLTNLKYFKEIEDTLKERDAIIHAYETPLHNEFWSKVCMNFNNHAKIFDSEIPLIKNLQITLTEKYECKINIILCKNPFVSNKYIFKKNNLFTGEIECTKIDFLTEKYPKFLNFFSTEKDNLEYFDLLFDMYTHALDYFLMNI